MKTASQNDKARARIAVISAACALAADARTVVETRSQFTQEISDLLDAIERFERELEILKKLCSK